MNKTKFVTHLIIIFLFFFLLAVLINMIIEAGCSAAPSSNHSEMVIPCAVLAFLLIGMVIFYLFPHLNLRNSSTVKVVKYIAIVGLVWFLPQSTLLYEKTHYFFRSEIVVFTIYNIIEFAIGNLVIKLLYDAKKSSS